MSDYDASLRRFLGHLGLASLGALGLTSLAGCASSASTANRASGASTITRQSNLASLRTKTATERVVADFNKLCKGNATLNTIASQTYRTQLPTYLTSPGTTRSAQPRHSNSSPCCRYSPRGSSTSGMRRCNGRPAVREFLQRYDRITTAGRTVNNRASRMSTHINPLRAGRLTAAPGPSSAMTGTGGA